MVAQSGALETVTQQQIIESLPVHLRPFVQHQDYADYTARDQAVWRFVMQQLTRQLADTAHPVYLEGLARTGIAVDRIPSIEEMNQCLATLGWRAVVVDGFIPPAIFMEFQALKVLVIALDIRDVDHVFYTPAPDIIHESAGHAPFIVDIDYAEFLQRFGEVGMKAIATRHDLDQYEAIRNLSILKECPDSTSAQIAEAESALLALAARDVAPSEAALLTRLHWWTVEYGLVGELDDYRIFGAGLLSSLGEADYCLSEEVTKLPLTLDAVLVPYDITRPQPQLFVTRSCKHLGQVLEEFAASMCYRKGGADSLRTAIDAGSVCTATYNTGMQVSGIFTQVLCDAVDKPIYLRTTGPTQLACDGVEIQGHGVAAHADGFGSPIGSLKDFSRCLSEYTVDELKAHNIEIGAEVRLDYLSGVTVQGKLEGILRQGQRNQIFSFSDCTVQTLGGDRLFEPSWGVFDLVVGAGIPSVCGGVADRSRLQLHKPLPATQTLQAQPDRQLMHAYTLAATVSAHSEVESSRAFLDPALWSELKLMLDAYPDEWLLRAELLSSAQEPLRSELLQDLSRIGGQSQELGLLTRMVTDVSSRD